MLVRNFARWPRLDDCLRVTIGRPEENDAFLAALKEVLAHEHATHRRVAERKRSTKETEISVRIDLDGSGKAKVSTGIPFFDHMLEQIGRHGGFDLELTARGDLDVDTHHTIEDTGIVLGAAFAEALGDKAGVRRFASCLLPWTRPSSRWPSTCRAGRSSSTRSTSPPR